MTEEFDVLVIGAGASGGLPAAAYLQKAGVAVALVEQSDSVGLFSASYERAPGARFDVSPVNFSIVSPALEDLALADHGYRVEPLPILFSTLDGSGRGLTLFPDQQATADQFAPYSVSDAATYRRLMGGLREHSAELLKVVFFTPRPDLDRAVQLTAAATGIEADDLVALTAPALVERLFESDAVRIALTALPAINLFGDLLEPGQGALTWLWTYLLRSGRAPDGAASLPGAVLQAFLGAGGTLLSGCRVTEFVTGEDGACCGVLVDDTDGSRVVRARHAVVSNLGAPLTSALLGRELAPDWRTAGRTVFTADLVLDRPLAWSSMSFRRSPRVYLVWRDWGECVRWLSAARDELEDVFLDHLEPTQFSVLYGVGEGGAGLRVRFGTGPFLDDSWDARRVRYERALRDRIRDLDPQVEIRSIDLTTPLDYWRSNPAARHGNPVGGDFSAGQWLGERLDYRTAVPRLYASNSVWPTPLSWMAPGHNAAWAVADDLGLGDTPWWRARR